MTNKIRINNLTGDVSLNEQFLFGRKTCLREFIIAKIEHLQLGIVNIPYRNFSLKTDGYWFMVTFYAEKLISASIAIDNNVNWGNIEELARGIGIKNDVFSWGRIGVDDGNGRDPIPHIWISYRQPNEKFPDANFHYPPIRLYPDGVDKEAKKFVDINFDKKCLHIGWMSFSKDANIALPEWLNWNTGPICKRCGREMTFYARLALPNNTEKHYVDVFFCPVCFESSSMIKE